MALVSPKNAEQVLIGALLLLDLDVGVLFELLNSILLDGLLHSLILLLVRKMIQFVGAENLAQEEVVRDVGRTELKEVNGAEDLVHFDSVLVRHFKPQVQV